MNAAEPRVTVIVVAPELNDYGRRCLTALANLRERPRVIFVPDGDEPPPDPRIEIHPSGAGLTTGEKRQTALEKATGDVVALIDDDAYPQRSWLRNALAALDSDAEIGAVAGPTLTPDDDSELERLGGRVYASALVSGPSRWRYRIADPRDVDDAPSVNLVVRREHAVAVGFASADRWGEDTLVCEGILRRGARISYEPTVIVYHSRRPLWRPHLRQLYRWSRHRSAYARTIGGNSLRPAYFAPSVLVLFAASGPLTRGRARKAWRLGLSAYGVAVAAAGFDRRPSRWLRVAGGIVATHVVYGAGFILGLLGARPPR